MGVKNADGEEARGLHENAREEARELHEKHEQSTCEFWSSRDLISLMKAFRCHAPRRQTCLITL